VSKFLYKDNPLVAELRGNKRLQWLLLLIGVILMLSLTKSLGDSNRAFIAEAQTKLGMLQRLQSAANEETPEETVTLIATTAKEITDTISPAQSVSVAEAEALSAVVKLTADFIEDRRASLVGSESINYGGRNFWQVRVELKGKMDQRALTGLLSLFDGSRAQMRVISMRYQPNSNGNIALVLDFLYRNNPS